MNAETIHHVVSMIETHVQSRPSGADFEMAYQVRVAIDRIRFAVKQAEQLTHADQRREVGLQLLDAIDRLEAVDRCFQDRSRIQGNGQRRSHPASSGAVLNP